MQDNEIIELYFARSEKAISETEKKYGGYLGSIAYSILRDRSDCEEVVNDCYLKTWNSIPPARPQSLKAYIGRIVRNLSLNAFDKQSAKKRGRGSVQTVLDELSEVIPSDDCAEDRLYEHELSKLLDRFLGGLDEKTRIVFVRRYWYLNGVKDIAKACKLSEGAVKMRLKRTREKLKEFLEQEGFGYE